MTPESVGVKQTSLVMGKHSGRHAFKDKLNSLGYPDLTDDVVSNAFAKFKVLGRESIFDNVETPYSSISVSDSFDDIICKRISKFFFK